ncbi:DUF6048 family protein [Lacinutrix iliipiscaria]|uniref:DUF6048 family protein n=1 Tax=Lacinutrix iliipiscaria TaxID=1230532 RepID=A0ABW5WPN3_9FLAO
MKLKHTSTYITKLFAFFILFCGSVHAQNDSIAKAKKDSIKHEQKYGLRIGGDLSKLVRTALDDDYKGFEIMADFRLTKKWYIAGELGTEERTLSNDYLSSTASGTYFKAGVDYNAYVNWYGMHNMIYGGLRIGASTFSQTRNNFTVYSQNQYWEPQFSSNDAQKFSGLSALWAELIIGIKAEVLPNLFVGINAQLKSMINQDQPDNFENLYVPGFNRTYDSGRFGVGYGYNISYLIPLFKKDK